MSSISSTLLFFGLLLGLSNLNLSTGQKWEAFKKSHIISSPTINCTVVMSEECQERRSFIHTQRKILEQVCKSITGRKNVSRKKDFSVSTCKRQPNTTCTYGEAELQRGAICVTCRNKKPVQFVKMGTCLPFTPQHLTYGV